MGGMIAATVLGVFFVPLFFTGIARMSRKRNHHDEVSGA
jgi:hypothetical protein